MKTPFVATIEHELALKHKYELEKIEAETKARAKAARENRYVSILLLLITGSGILNEWEHCH